MMLRPVLLLLLAGASYLTAQGTGLRLFFHLSYLLIALLLLALLWAWLNLRGLVVTRELLSPRATVGEYARERIHLRNHWLLPKLWVELRDESQLPGHGAGFVASFGMGEQGRWLANTRCTQRGRFRLGPATLLSGDPFGIVLLKRHVASTNEILVYPPTEDLPQFSLPGADLSGGQATRARAFHVSPNVAGIRDYVPGDSMSYIHWRSTARTGRLMIKEFELDPSADVYMILDMQERAVVQDRRRSADLTASVAGSGWPREKSPQSRSVPYQPSTEEYAVVATASLARALLAQGRVVGLVAWGQQHEVIPAERESRQLLKILEALAVLRAHSPHPLAELLLAEHARFSRDCTLVIVTSSVDERWVGALQQLLYRKVRAVVVFIDPQSFGGRYDPTPILRRLAELRVTTYRISQGGSIADALSTPYTFDAAA